MLISMSNATLLHLLYKLCVILQIFDYKFKKNIIGTNNALFDDHIR